MGWFFLVYTLDWWAASIAFFVHVFVWIFFAGYCSGFDAANDVVSSFWMLFFGSFGVSLLLYNLLY